ncbi:MAG: rRNA maturation RNase YbeY [Dehalococcoidia bacterium]
MTDIAYQLSIEIDEPFASKVDVAALERAITATLIAEEIPAPAEISLQIADDATIQALNRDYRGIDAATDVLSFGFEADEFVVPPDGVRHLGEVVIAFPYTERSAERQGHPTAHELVILTVHGTLHVLGYDDEEDEAWEVMKARQESILASLDR